MKPVIIDKKCGAGKDSCKAIKACPTQAIYYTEVKEPILDREVNCISSPDNACGCSCDCGSNGNACGGSPYSRIAIDYEKCIECGLCVDACCGKAIEMK